MNVSAPDAVVARTKTFAAASDGTKTTCHALPSGLLQLLGLSEFCKRRLDIMKALQIVLRAPGREDGQHGQRGLGGGLHAAAAVDYAAPEPFRRLHEYQLVI
mmetsp:Transcript_15916/g.47880  ORF Transcript_15916/g.47880 Transcript_15916/m.47880 type:complete len:102 (+) Transcript_15916:1-306(+)